MPHRSVSTASSLLFAAALLCSSVGAAAAAQSANFVLQDVGPGNAAGVTHGSTNYRMEGDLSWRQETPLRGQTFQITNAPPAPASSSVATSSSSSSASAAPSDGGGRGDGTTTTTPPASARPPVASSSSSASSEEGSSSQDSSSSASSLESSASDDASSSTSSDLHGAAESSAGSGASAPCDTVLCNSPHWRPIDLLPVPDERPSGEGVGSIAHRILIHLAAEGGAASSFVLLPVLAFLLSLAFGVSNSHVADVRPSVRRLWYVFLVLLAALGKLLQ